MLVRRFNSLSEAERAKLLEPGTRHIYCDPGKRDLLTMVDDDDHFFRYSNHRRTREACRRLFNDKSKRRRAEMGVSGSAEEVALSTTTHNSNDRTEFMAYVVAKIAYSRRFGAGFRQPCHRAYRWHQYVERQRADNKIISRLLEYANNDKQTPIFYGDWSTTRQLKGFVSTPCLRIRRLVAKVFPRIYLVDEFRTSKLYWRDPTRRMKNVVTTTPARPVQFKIHALLTLTGDNNEGPAIRINRDRNAVRNIRAIVQHQLATGERLEAFQR